MTRLHSAAFLAIFSIIVVAVGLAPAAQADVSQPVIAKSEGNTLAPTASSNIAKIGVYVVDLQDLNFVNNTFNASFWIWSTSKNDQINPLKTMEFVRSKSPPSVGLYSSRKKDGETWAQERVQGTFNHQWDMTNFPLDRHVLSLVVEESLDDAGHLVYEADKDASGLDKSIVIPGFKVTKVNVQSGTREYTSNFGDQSLPPVSKYTQLHMDIEVQRDSMVLFMKLHIGLYAAFLISACCFLMLPAVQPVPSLGGSVFGVLVGALFATIMNLRAVDSIIGRSESITLVDRLHFMTLMYFVIAGVIGLFVLCMRNRLKDKTLSCLSYWSGGLYVGTYILANVVMIHLAAT